jgi:hypothetical protein
MNMTEKTSSTRPFGDHIPSEAREHMKSARDEMRKGFEALFPEEFVKHGKAARREMLLAWRSMIDAALEKTEEKSK